jgi:poly [ADP-ribose] polymerase 10/14/15
LLGLLSASNPSCKRETSGINVYVDQDLKVVKKNESQAPALPDGTPTLTYGHIHGCSSIKGTITVGGHLSMDKSDAYYPQSTQIRRSVQIFLDWLNDERGGVLVNGSRYAMRFRWVADASSKQQVALAMANALRGDDASDNVDFAFAGYSSGLTEFASMQSHADGKLMLAATAASSQAFAHNNMTFGTESNAPEWVKSAIEAIESQSANFTKFAAGESASTRGTESLKVGFVTANALFTKSTCEPLVDWINNKGLSVTKEGMKLVDKSPELDVVMDALRPLRDDGVNVLVGCTYYATGLAIIKALERLDFSPLAVVMTACVGLPGYADLIARGWWQGEYFLGVAPWHTSVPYRGEFSGMSSSEFADRYRARYSASVAYQGASQFAACCALAAAIEAANSVDTQKVLKAIRQLQLLEFFGPIQFGANGQNVGRSNLVVQYARGSLKELVVAPPSAVTEGIFAFPMPTWSQRRCRVSGPGKTWADSANVEKDLLPSECSGTGKCSDEGLCVCDEGWSGLLCSSHIVPPPWSFPVWATVLIAVSVASLGGAGAVYVWWYKNRHVKAIQKELTELKDSVVGMRSVVHDYFPPGGEVSIAITDIAAPRERAIWYWGEDIARMGSHNANLTLAPCWVMYAGSVAAELEDHYQLALSGAAPATFETDLTDRIASTGTEAKAYGQSTGSKYIIDFNAMKQINVQSGFRRDIYRQVAPAGPASAQMADFMVMAPAGSVAGQLIQVQSPDGQQIQFQIPDDTGPGYIGPGQQFQVAYTPLVSQPGVVALGEASQTSAASKPSTDNRVPSDLSGEMLLAMKAGSIVSISKQRPDGWAYGSVVYKPDEGSTLVTDQTEKISFDAGWFPLNATEPPTREALEKLQQMMGPAGAHCLDAPSTWADQKGDTLVAQFFALKDGPEKDMAVNWFMGTLGANVKVVKVERIQNVSLWQSFAVKRQTVLSREGDTTTDGTSKFERKWLFHGTTAEIVPKVAQQGFNRSFCGRNATMYGKGVYFARDASYSSSKAYSAPDPNGIQRMFLCRVIVGLCSKGVKDAVCPDVRDAAQHLLFDTTVDNVKDPSIFVTYHDAQAYPEYLVHFKQ